jgi:hypothetical protein
VVDVLGDQYRWLFLFGALFMALAWLGMTQVRHLAVSDSAAVSKV